MVARSLAFCFGLLLVTVGASARPRDDAMSSVFNCNQLESDRQWLDCYYGAAQPARASLGLKAALPEQVQLALAPHPGGKSAPSAVRSQVIGQAGRCYDAGEEKDWLDCYYQAALPMRVQLGLDPASVTKLSPAPRLATADAIAGNIVSRVADYGIDRQNILTVTLENGQVWRQIDGDSNTAHWQKPAGMYLATIRRGMSGSFILTVRGDARVFRMRRIG